MVVRFRKAFTFIELIFAIVIIAISVVSLPTLIQATSSGVEKNLEVQEAMFKAVVLTKSVIGENSFNSIDTIAVASPTLVADNTGLVDYKFAQKYTISITPNATFNGETSGDIKKITTVIYNQSGSPITSFSAYKFNY